MGISEVRVAVLLAVVSASSLTAQVRPREGLRPDQIADLEAVALTPSAAYPSSGEVITAAFKVRNRGARLERNVVLTLFAGRTRVTSTTADLKAGETVVVPLSWKAAAAGSVTLTAHIDYDQKMIEWDRVDNMAAADVVVAQKPPSQTDSSLSRSMSPSVDLRVENLSIAAAQFDQTRPRQITIAFRVTNVGSEPVKTSFRTTIFPGNVRQNKREPFTTYSVSTKRLDAGSSVYISRTIVSPSSSFVVRVATDADRVVAESDETNNLITSQFENPSPDVDRWISIGPRLINNGGLGAVGRLSAIAIHPSLPGTIFVGAQASGVWKTVDGGSSWQPVSDALPTLGVGALAIDPSAPARIYLATPDSGVYRSEDAGISWSHLPGSPSAEVRWGVLLIHPTSLNVLYMSSSAGVYRSRDSGSTWQLVLGGARATDLVMDATRPDVVYAAKYGSGIYKTMNGGDTWDQLTAGLPSAATSSGTIYQITLAISRGAPDNLYAAYSQSSGYQLYRTTDAGLSWSLQVTPPDATLYNDVIGVDPVDPQFVYITGVRFYRWDPGTMSLVAASGPHADQHAFASDFNTGAIYALNDGGIFRSADRGATWAFIGEGITNVEFYDHAIANTQPGLVIGGTQDNGTVMYDGSTTVWNEFRGGDGSTVAIDPINAQILYSTYQGVNDIQVHPSGGNASIPIGVGLPEGCAEANAHFQTHPKDSFKLLASPTPCGALYRGLVSSSPSFSASWTAIFSPDTGNVVRSAVDPSIDLHYAGTSSGELWAGPAGANWRKVFFVPTPRRVTDIEVDPNDPATVYLSVGGDTGNRVYMLRRSSTAPSAGTTISRPITAGLPNYVSVKTLAVDRMRPFTLYAGTGRGVYRGRSADGGVTWVWTPYTNGMPAADVRDLEVHPTTGVIRAATHGRSIFEVNTDHPLGSLLAAEGTVTLLRVHDVGTGYGPPTDRLDVEVIIWLDSEPGKAFGFQLRTDATEKARRGMLKLLRDAFNSNGRVRIDYVRTGIRTGRILRVMRYSKNPKQGLIR